MIAEQFAFHEFFKNIDENKRAALIYQLQRSQNLENLKRQQEREQLKNEIIDEILKRINIEVDIAEAVQKIEELNKSIENLGM